MEESDILCRNILPIYLSRNKTKRSSKETTVKKGLGERAKVWLKEWTKRHIIDDAPELDESHSATRESTLDEVNRRRGHE